MPLTLAPARDTAPNGMLTGRPMNVANVATLDIPVALVNPFQQASSHVSRHLSVLFGFFIIPFL